MIALLRNLPGPALVMLYILFGNEDAKAEIKARIEVTRKLRLQNDSERA
jgi:hypothetical protein